MYVLIFKNDELLDREHLHILQQFTLNRESEEIREELYEYMIMSVIFRYGGNESCIETAKIHKLVKTDFHLTAMPSMQLKDGISRLIHKNSIHEEKNLVTLSKINIQKFKQGSNDIVNLEKTVLADLKIELTKKLPTTLHYLVEIVLKNFDNFMGEIFRRFGLQAAQFFANGESNLRDLNGFTTFSDFYEYSDLKSLTKEQKIEFENILHEFFANPTKERSQYFFSMSQSYVLTQILNVEPDLKKIQIKSLSKKKVYLDTNIIINLLFQSTSGAVATSDLINETKKLQLKLIITEKTSSEFKTWLEKQEKRLKNFKLPSTKLASALGEFDARTDQILFVYSKELQKNPNLNIKNFCKKFYEVETLLLNKYGVTYEKTDKNLEASSDVKKLITSVKENASGEKDEFVALHDAYVIARIRQLRAANQGDEMGPNAWFLTTDTTLEHSESEVFSVNEIPATILLESWFQVISTFISPIGSAHQTSIAFAKFLSSYFDSCKIKVNDYLNFVDALTDDADFTLEQLKKIVGDNFIKQKLRTINRNRENDDIPTQNEIQKAVVEMQKLSKGSFDQELEKIREEYSQRLRDEVLRAENAEKAATEANKKAMEADKKATEADKNRKGIKIKSILIILALGTLVINIILDLTIFKDIFIEQSSNVILVLGFNISLTVGIPKFVHFLYKAD